MAAKIPHVIILGGGFGGLAAATEIRRRVPPSHIRITVIDRRDWFMVGFAKLWIIRGTRTFEDSANSLHALRRNGVEFVQAEIEGIDLARRVVRTSEGRFEYDFVVLAMGARLAPEKVPGLAENGLNLYDHRHLDRIRRSLLEIRSGRVAIGIMSLPYKCPPAPFEAGLLVRSLLRETGRSGMVEVEVYSPAPLTLPAAGPAVSQKVLAMLQREDIKFHPSSRVVRVRPRTMEFERGRAEFDLLLAVPPHTAPSVVYDAGLAEGDGFVRIGRDCKISEGVYAVGDITNMPAGPAMAVPKAGVFAEGQGLTVARDIIASVNLLSEENIFDGCGACFIESGRDTAALVEVDMFSGQGPATNLTDATAGHLDEKARFESERVRRWLG